MEKDTLDKGTADQSNNSVQFARYVLEQVYGPPPTKASNDKVSDGSKDLWDGKDWKVSINPSALKQGDYGDCFFEATVASLANSDKGKQTIHDMIKENSDGSYTITFPGDKGHPITITQADMDKWHTQNDARWADVIEAAFMEYNTSKPVWGGFWTQYGVPPIGTVSSMQEAAKLMTGDPVSTDQFALSDIGSQQAALGWTSRDNVRRDLIAAMKNQSVVTAGAGFEFASAVYGNSPTTVPTGHAYSVLAFDPATDTVSVRNPWGTNEGTSLPKVGDTKNGITNTGDGKLTMSLDTFMKEFSDITISGTTNTTSATSHLANGAIDFATNATQAQNALLHFDVNGLIQNAVSAGDDLSGLPAEALHAETQYEWEYIKHALDNPAQVVLPPLSIVTYGADEIKNTFSSWFHR